MQAFELILSRGASPIPSMTGGRPIGADGGAMAVTAAGEGIERGKQAK